MNLDQEIVILMNLLQRVDFSQLVVQVSADGQNPRAQLSQLVILVSTGWTPPIVADSVNNWQDAVSTQVTEEGSGKSVSVADDLNNWVDLLLSNFAQGIECSDDLAAWDDLLELSLDFALVSGEGLDVMYLYDLLEIDFLAFVGGLQETAADDLNSFADSKSYQLTGNYQATNDWYYEDIFHLSDSIQLGFMSDNPTVGDDLNLWNDFVEGVLGVPEAYDSNMYNWGDAIAITPGIAIQKTDSLSFVDAAAVVLASYFINVSGADSFSLSDIIKLSVAFNKYATDFFSLSDRAIAQFTIAKHCSDILTILDLISILLGIEDGTIEDNLSLSDDIQISLSIHMEGPEVTDSLNMADAVSAFISTTDVNYLRRYLNDVARY